MADVQPFRGILFNPEHIRLGGVLAPPYDVISDEQRAALYARDLRNIVRIDYGMEYPDDVVGANDRYTRAAGHLEAWLHLGLVAPTQRPAYVITAHEFTMPDGSPRRRIGIFATVPARPWETAEIRPHERTLRGPKADRLALMRATHTQTSAVFALWDQAPDIDTVFGRTLATAPLLGGRTHGEFGDEKHLVWLVDDTDAVAATTAALADSVLYMADGHHRYETAVAYAAERAAAGDATPESQRCLVYLCAADDDGMTLLPTHRLVRQRAGVPRNVRELEAAVPVGTDVVAVDSLDEARRAQRLRHATHHAYAVALADGAALVTRRREPHPGSPREDLDVVVLEELLIHPLGIDAAAISDGALRYTRDVEEIEPLVAGGEVALGVVVSPATVPEVMAVADAGEVMPQKSTYFYPKVPTGIVLAPC